MKRLLAHLVGIVLASLGAFAGLVGVQLLRLRRVRFLPHHPGFYVDRVVEPAGSVRGPTALRLLVFGDSTTAGVGVDSADDALPTVVAGLMADARQRPVHVTSYGWSGARIADLVRDQLPRAMQPLRAGESEPVLPAADLILVVIGANDATNRTPTWRFRTSLRTLLAQIRHDAPAARVVLAGIPGFRGALPHLEPLVFLTDRYAALLRRIQRHEAEAANVAFADLARHAGPRLRGRPAALSVDFFHPSAYGYAVWGDVIAAAVEEPRRTASPTP